MTSIPKRNAAMLLTILLIAACQQRRPDLDLSEPIVDDRRDENGVGIVVVELEEGRGIYFFNGGQYPFDQFTHPIAGKAVHYQDHTLTLRNGRQLERWVVVTETGEGENRETTVTIYERHPDPRLFPALRELAKHKHKGGYQRNIVNETDNEKTFFFGDDGWLLIDLVTGRKLGASDHGVPNDVVSVEVVDSFIILIQPWNNETEIRMRIFGPDGRLISTIVMPGDYVTSTSDRRDLKAVVTVHAGGTVFQDLLRVSTGMLITQQAGNGINGDHAHLQYDPTAGGRFIEIVFNPGRDDTEVRIMTSDGIVMATHVLPGRFKRAVVAGTPPNEYKVIATERLGRAAATVIDLTTGAHVSTTEATGAFVSLVSGQGTVALESVGQTLPIPVP